MHRNLLGIKFFTKKRKTGREKLKQSRWAIYEEIQEITDNAAPVATKKPKSLEWNYSTFKCPLIKSCKISNMSVEVSRIHEDYATATIFTLMKALNGLLVLAGVTKVSKPIENIQKKNWVFSEVAVHVCEEERWHVSLQKYINEIHLRVAIDRFLRSPPLNKPFFFFSLSLTPRLLRQIKY